MTIKNLTEKIMVDSFNRETLERLLTKEIKKKVETAVLLSQIGGKISNEIISETLKSD